VFAGVGCGVSMLCLAGYMYAHVVWTAEGEPAAATWFPVMALFVFYACSTIGYLIVPWVMIGEVFPRQIRGMVGGVATCIGHFSTFIVLQTYPVLQEWVSKPGTFAVYGTVSILSTWFFYYFCPETKGKTLQEIEESFEKKKPKKPIVAHAPVPENASPATVAAAVPVTAPAAAVNHNNNCDDTKFSFSDVVHRDYSPKSPSDVSV